MKMMTPEPESWELFYDGPDMGDLMDARDDPIRTSEIHAAIDFHRADAFRMARDAANA